MPPARARTRNAQSVGDRANHEATTPPQMDWTKLGMKKNLKKKNPIIQHRVMSKDSSAALF